MTNPQSDLSEMESEFADTDTLLGAREWIKEALTDAGAEDAECDEVSGNYADMIVLINGVAVHVSLSLIQEEVEH